MTIESYTRYEGDLSYSLPRHGGVQARSWRKRIAVLAKKQPQDAMRTLSFPLEVVLDDGIFAPSNTLYNTVQDFEQGSLNHLLLCSHLCGLSLFGSQLQAATARQSGSFPDANFAHVLQQTQGLDIPKLVPSKLYDLFRAVPRQLNGKDTSFTRDNVANRIHVMCMGKSMNEKTADDLRALMLYLADAVLDSADSYEALKENASLALRKCGQAMQKISSEFASLDVPVQADSLDVCFAYEGKVDGVDDEEPQSHWLHHIVACLLRQNPQAKPPEIQDQLLSPQNNALSQLFGVLLFDARGQEGRLRKWTVDEFCELFQIPSERRGQVARLLQAAQAIAKPPLFKEGNYSGYRALVAGRLKSWVSNYLTRLNVLQEQIQQMQAMALPPTDARVVEILEGLGLSMDEVEHLHRERKDAIDTAQQQLAVLAGKSLVQRPIQAAQGLEVSLKKIADIHGSFRAVLNQIDQLREDLPLDSALKAWHDALKAAAHDTFVLPHISGGAPDVEMGLTDINQNLQCFFSGFKALSDVVAQAATGQLQDFLQASAEQERVRAKGRLQDAATEAPLLAQQRLLHGLERMARRLSPASQEVVMAWFQPLMVTPQNRKSLKLYNRMRFNAQGRFYKSPWSPARHAALPFNRQVFAQVPWFERLQTLASGLYQQLAQTPSAAAFQDWVEVQRLLTEMRIQTLPLPVCKAQIEAALPLADYDLHYRLRMALSQPQWTLADVSNLLSWLASQLSRMRFFVRREQFIVRHVFSRVGENELLYVPKPGPWQMPDTYFDAKEGIGPFLREHATWVTRGQAVDVPAVFEQVAQLPPNSGNGHFLFQLPHDWYVNLGFSQQAGTSVKGLPVGKKRVREQDKRTQLLQCQAARLRGPSTYLNQLAGMLLAHTEAKEWSLVLDWTHQSTLTWQDGAPSIAARRSGCQASLAVPMENKQLAANEHATQQPGLFDKLVAIDLGERQIGYAVFDIPQALPLQVKYEAVVADVSTQWGNVDLQPVTDPQTGQPANGALRIAGVKRLIHAVKSHRSRQAGNTKLKQNYDKGLAHMREAVTSEVVQKIEALCARFGGFPVLESSVSNFQTGARQLDLVYGDVVRHFAFSGVEAHKARRQMHWLGAETWAHPYLMELPFDETTKSRNRKLAPKALNLFPGTTVHPAGTSQTCNVCGRNPLAQFKLKDQADEPRLTVLEAGLVDLPDGQVRLWGGSDYPEDEARQMRRQKRNPPLNKPLRAGVYSVRDLMRFCKLSMRQKNPHQMARDTSQSWYHCVYVNCCMPNPSGAEPMRTQYHADAGAAINIGRKFFSTRIAAEASLNRWRTGA